MLKHFLPLSFSLSLLMFSSSPAFAQTKRATQTPQPSSDPTEAAPQTAHAGRLEPSFRFYAGPALELGNRSLTVTRQRTTGVKSFPVTNGANNINTVAASQSLTNTALENGLGYMYGAEGTWWGTERLGLEMSVFGAMVNSTLGLNIMHLNGQDAASYKESASVVGTQNITTSLADSTTIVPNVPGVGNYGVVMTIPAAGVTTPIVTTYNGFTLGAVPALALNQGDDAATNPKASYSSEGGVSYSYAQSTWVNDLALTGKYAVVETPNAGVSFFGGLLMPVGSVHKSFTAKTVGKNGQGDEAVQTAIVTTNGDGANSYHKTTKWKANDTYSVDIPFLLAGPVIGLSAAGRLGSLLHLYSRVGYAPVLTGTMTSNATISRSYQTTEVIDSITGTPGVTAGTNVNSNGANVPTSTVSNIGGSETMASLGLGFYFSGLHLFGEGTAHSYNLGGVPVLLYGANLGMALTF